MSAEILREAAALMRERAADATPGPWESGTDGWTETISGDGEDWCYVRQVGATSEIAAQMLHGDDALDVRTERDAEHIASWHPAVALAVADWLDAAARVHGAGGWIDQNALGVARAYLGRADA